MYDIHYSKNILFLFYKIFVTAKKKLIKILHLHIV